MLFPPWPENEKWRGPLHLLWFQGKRMASPDHSIELGLIRSIQGSIYKSLKYYRQCFLIPNNLFWTLTSQQDPEHPSPTRGPRMGIMINTYFMVRLESKQQDKQPTESLNRECDSYRVADCWILPSINPERTRKKGRKKKKKRLRWSWLFFWKNQSGRMNFLSFIHLSSLVLSYIIIKIIISAFYHFKVCSQ